MLVKVIWDDLATSEAPTDSKGELQLAVSQNLISHSVDIPTKLHKGNQPPKSITASARCLLICASRSSVDLPEAVVLGGEKSSPVGASISMQRIHFDTEQHTTHIHNKIPEVTLQANDMALQSGNAPLIGFNGPRDVFLQRGSDLVGDRVDLSLQSFRRSILSLSSFQFPWTFGTWHLEG